MKEKLLFMSRGSGISVCDKNREENNDYLNVAHISYNRKITYHTQDLSLDAMSAIEDFATFENTSISASQKDIYALHPLNYKQFSFDRLVFLADRYFQYFWNNSGKYEFEYYMNDISRAIIQKYQEKYHTCYLGKIKRDEKETGPIELVAYNGEFIHEFQYDFILPFNDKRLTHMINTFNNMDQPASNSNLMQQSITIRIKCRLLKE